MVFTKHIQLSIQFCISLTRLHIVNTTQTNMDKRLFSCGAFIDLKKAFDTVDHKIILDKLYHYGFRDIINEWFSSYLEQFSNDCRK